MPQSQTFSLTFRGVLVRFSGLSAKVSWTSIYPEQHVLLTYPRRNGAVASVPVIEKVVRTAATLQREVRDREVLRSFPGQSFIIRVTPGVTEVTEAEVVA